jgi:hypothetical protein
LQKHACLDGSFHKTKTPCLKVRIGEEGLREATQSGPPQRPQKNRFTTFFHHPITMKNKFFGGQKSSQGEIIF